MRLMAMAQRTGKMRPNDIHPWIQIDLGAAYSVTEIAALWLNGNTKTFHLDGSTDGGMDDAQYS